MTDRTGRFVFSDIRPEAAVVSPTLAPVLTAFIFFIPLNWKKELPALTC